MALATKPRQRPSRNCFAPENSAARYHASKYAIDEINAYIAVRDGLVEEAARERSDATLERLALANNFVTNCLGPARQPYLTQCLPETDAARELKRCQAVDTQIAKWRAQAATAA